MSEHIITDYTFLGLCGNGRSPPFVTSLVYVVGLVDSVSHKVGDLKWVNASLPSIFDSEEQIENAADLPSWQEATLPSGFYPQTPCMLTKAWSPIGAMLEQGFEPLLLRRDCGALANATGIWEASAFESTRSTDDIDGFEQLFWAILGETFRRAMKRKMLVSIIAKPGWSYEAGIDSLPKWTREEIAKADRILWQRTPEG